MMSNLRSASVYSSPDYRLELQQATPLRCRREVLWGHKFPGISHQCEFRHTLHRTLSCHVVIRFHIKNSLSPSLLRKKDLNVFTITSSRLDDDLSLVTPSAHSHALAKKQQPHFTFAQMKWPIKVSIEASHLPGTSDQHLFSL